jgi:hypothetical protein
MQTYLKNLFITLAIWLLAPPLHAQGTTAFTYQGQLRDGGTNANGAYTMMFALYDSAGSGNEIGSAITTSPTLANGLFTVNLDFGTNAFNGSARWLDITINNGGTPQTLSPRVQVLPAPYALYAANANIADIAQNVVSAINITNAVIINAIVTNSTISGNGAGLSNVSAATLSNGTWSVSTGVYQGVPNILGVYDNNSLLLGMDTNSVAILGKLSVSDNLQVGDQIQFGINNNTVSIVADGNGGLIFQGNGSPDGDNALSVGNINLTGGNGNPGAITFSNNCVSASISGGCGDSNGEIFIQGDVITDGTIRLGTDANANNSGGSGLASDGNGGLTFLGSGESGSISGDNEGGLNLNGNVVVHGNLGVNGCINGQFCQSSDKNLKEKFTPIDNQGILERVANLPISSWNYKKDQDTRHIGPMAQDFYAAFNVGSDDKHIATIDESGVALAAIQGLNDKLKEKDTQIESLKKRMSDLEQLVKGFAKK